MAEPLSAVLTRHGSDKGTIHSYADVYEELLGPRRLEELALLEIGVAHGGCLKAWLEWLPNSRVYGADIRLPSGLEHDRLTLYHVSQVDADELWQIFQPGTLDVVIDDASHYLPHQLLTLHYLWPALKPGGYYFVEDVRHLSYLPFFEMMPGYRAHRGYKGNRVDDLMVICQKPREAGQPNKA